MKKIIRYGICGVAALMLVAGCSKKENDPTTEAVTESAVETESTEETPAETTEAAKDLIAKADYGTVELGEYKGLEVEAVSAEVTDEEIQSEIDAVLQSNPEYVEITDRATELGDVVNIDYVGLKDGVAFDGGTAEGYDLELGSGSFIEGFEEGLVGYKKGDEVSLNLTFPEAYHSADLAGQEVVFEVTINSVEEVRDAELNDDFVQRVSDNTTVDEFREEVKAMLVAYKEEEAEYGVQVQALQQAIDNATIECNPDAIEQEYQGYYSSYESQAAMYGMTMENFATMSGGTLEDLKAQLRIQAEQLVKQYLLVNAVSEAENLAVEDTDRQVVAENNGMELDALVANYGQEAVDEVALTYKVVQFLAENAVVK